MTFVTEDEFIILFDAPNHEGNCHSLDDLRLLASAGIRTAILTNQHMDRPQATEDTLNRYAKAGIKVLLPLWSMHSAKCLTDWYSRDTHGSIGWVGAQREYILSPWHLRAQEWLQEELRKWKAQYQSSTVQIVTPIIRDGESVMPQDPRCYDRAALASWHKINSATSPDMNDELCREWIKAEYTRMMVNLQRILVDSPWREIWTMFHLPKASRPACGVDWVEDYYKAFQELKPSAVNHITFSYFNFPKIERQIHNIQTRHNTIEWAGAEYCEGLRDGNGTRAINQGLRGMILSPLHYFTGHLQIKPWMIETISKTIEDYRQLAGARSLIA